MSRRISDNEGTPRRSGLMAMLTRAALQLRGCRRSTERVASGPSTRTTRPYISTVLTSGALLLSLAVRASTEPVEIKLVASDGAAPDLFGVSVSVAGDTAIVGSLQGDDDNGVNTGSAYVFERDGTGAWVERQKLTASDGTADDQFVAPFTHNKEDA